MKEYNQFEEHIAHKFETYQPNVDDDMIWNSIKGDIAPKKKRRIFIFWFIGLLLLTTAGFTTWHFASSKNEALHNDIVVLDKNPNTKSLEEKKSTTPIQDIKKEITLETESSSLNTIQKREHKTNSKPIESPIKVNKNQLASNQKSTTSNKTKLQNKQQTAFQFENTSKQNVKTNAVADQSTIDIRKILFPILITPLAPNPLMHVDRETMVLNTELAKSIINPLQSNKQLFSIIAAGSVYKPSFNYSGTDDELLALRNNHEKTLEAIQAELGFAFNINNSISLQTGLRFMSMQERSQFSTVTSNIETTEKYVTDDQNQLQLIKNTITQTNTRSVVRYNTTKSFSVPILVNYALINKGPHKFQFGIGIEKSLSVSRTGFELDAIDVEYNLNEDNEQRYKNSFGDYFLMSAVYQKQFGNHWSLYFGLEAKYGLNNITTSNSLLDKKYNFLGLSLGTNYHF